MNMRLTALGTGIVLLSASLGTAQTNWPQFRGEAAGVVADDPALPESWGRDENVAWRVDVPGRGWASPIVWGDHVFVLTSTAVDVRTKTWSPQTMGDAQPRPGTSTRHATFSSRPQLSGSAGSSATTPAASPRNCGQLVWAVPKEALSRTMPVPSAVNRMFIVDSSKLSNPSIAGGYSSPDCAALPGPPPGGPPAARSSPGGSPDPRRHPSQARRLSDRAPSARAPDSW